MATFTVDTHLFRELGELLVGRDSTALIELIKNSYDADAVHVVVYGEGLGEEGRGVIQISDDGIGMGPSEFEQGFLRVASRIKETQARRSPKFRRRYTGEKGVGRLAAHKLSRSLQVVSTPWKDGTDKVRKSVEAQIDWDAVEAKETLDQLEGTDAIRISSSDVGRDRTSGTVITLAKLRRAWTKREHGRFLEEIQTFSPPDILTQPLPKGVLKDTLLFHCPVVRDIQDEQDPGFHVQLEGELAPPEDYWKASAAAADWVVEIDASAGSETVRYGVTPTERASRSLNESGRRIFEVPHPDRQLGPHFTARFLVRTGQLRGSDRQRMWSTRNSGIRVFMEGFRVLPYGEAGNDWLRLDRDTVERGRSILGPPPASLKDELGENQEELGLLHLPQKHYFGAVFLTHHGAEGLRLLVNREGFVPSAAYDQLVQLVRSGVDLATRVRAAATKEARAERRTRRSIRAGQDAQSDEPLSSVLKLAVDEARAFASEAEQLSSKGDFPAASDRISKAVERVTSFSDLSEELARQSSMLHVLASVGTQLAGFIHEINVLLGSAEGIERSLEDLRSFDGLEQPEIARRISRLHQAAGDLRRHLERQASYLIDIVSPDARRRRSRQPIHDRFESARRLVSHLAERSGIEIRNEIPEEIRSPPMFPAELTAALANLLTNAVKAAGAGGRILAEAWIASGGSVHLRIANTGVVVDPLAGERWFRPFESSTTSVEPVLGQGMGLGLPITRTMIEEYGGDIAFVTPPPGFATAVELSFHGNG